MKKTICLIVMMILMIGSTTYSKSYKVKSHSRTSTSRKKTNMNVVYTTNVKSHKRKK